MLTMHDMDAAALEAEATVAEWEQEFQAAFSAPMRQASEVARYVANPDSSPTDQIKRQARWVQSRLKKQEVNYG